MVVYCLFTGDHLLHLVVHMHLFLADVSSIDCTRTLPKYYVQNNPV